MSLRDDIEKFNEQMAKDMPEGAQSWLDMWAEIDPDNPNLHYYRRQVHKQQRGGKKSGFRKRLGF